MADWDSNSPILQANLEALLKSLLNVASKRTVLNSDDARIWHKKIMQNLKVPKPEYVGRFRGEAELENIQVSIGSYSGSDPSQISSEIVKFDDKLNKAIAILDHEISYGEELTADNIKNILEVCSWAHAEWVRIHPFTNGNGRIARLWANTIAMRYGLPPFVRLRPRPDGGYGRAAQAAMTGSYDATIPVFLEMLNEVLRT